MLRHVSIPATNPAVVADVLAHLMGGEALPFVPLPGAWVAFAAGEDGTTVEVYPATTCMVPGALDVAFEQTTPRTPAAPAVHLAIETVLDTRAVTQLATQHGWLVREAQRGPFFSVIEVWLENSLMVEVMTRAMVADYLSVMTAERWRTLVMAGPPPA
ncbi:MAG: hypothetical protein EAZ99_01980 [Alphaproteobacteria bacterium]|nr:hypothetical protein [Alphaproteobacteria bacterium]TAD91449.1 MAG: hypothetical protein EAZ99_01980 [Alphaproteobacteria bacterium]